MTDFRNYSIFVVENNRIFNHLVTEYLKKQNFEKVKPVYSGEECIELIRSGEKPDIVIQDFLLEGINGIEVLTRVKKISPGTDFLFLTSNENMEVAVNTIKYGAYDYIVKDRFALGKVVDKLKKIIQMKKLQKRNRHTKISIVTSFVLLFLLLILAFLHYVMGWY